MLYWVNIKLEYYDLVPCRSKSGKFLRPSFQDRSILHFGYTLLYDAAAVVGRQRVSPSMLPATIWKRGVAIKHKPLNNVRDEAFIISGIWFGHSSDGGLRYLRCTRSRDRYVGNAMP